METYRFNDSDFVLYKKGGDLRGGFSLDSVSKSQKGGSETFLNQKEYVVPAGIFHNNSKKHYERHRLDEGNDHVEHETIPDSVYDRLLDLASVESNNSISKTRTTRKRLTTTTRKNTKKTFKKK
jgi:hypothetical protein